ncbi:MAG TPA: HPr-rel-A system PqqD family peptide chaperone [Polyangia bacterium]|nr:HPr-rel-A system PqqD family peptide chaperone [Polyangia bacterium]
MTNESETTWRRDPALPYQRMDEEAIVVDPRTRQVHLLNETAARIWELLATASSVDDLVATLADEYEGASPDALRAEVETFVSELGGKGLLTPRGRA